MSGQPEWAKQMFLGECGLGPNCVRPAKMEDQVDLILAYKIKHAQVTFRSARARPFWVVLRDDQRALERFVGPQAIIGDVDDGFHVCSTSFPWMSYKKKGVIFFANFPKRHAAIHM